MYHPHSPPSSSFCSLSFNGLSLLLFVSHSSHPHDFFVWDVKHIPVRHLNILCVCVWVWVSQTSDLKYDIKIYCMFFLFISSTPCFDLFNITWRPTPTHYISMLWHNKVFDEIIEYMWLQSYSTFSLPGIQNLHLKQQLAFHILKLCCSVQITKRLQAVKWERHCTAF